MRLSAMRVPVTDMVESGEFYTILLGKAPEGGDADAGFMVWHLENGDFIIEPEEPGEFEAGRFLGLSIGVDDIAGFYRQALDRDIEFAGEPEVQDWGGTLAHVEDPDGNFLSIVEMP